MDYEQNSLSNPNNKNSDDKSRLYNYLGHEFFSKMRKE